MESGLPDNVRLIPDFLTTFLTTEGTSIYRGASWIVKFDNLSTLLPAIKQATDYEPHMWETAHDYVTSPRHNEKNGCMFAQAISIPGESFQPVPGGNISSNAFIRPYIGAGRNAFPLLRMSFLETVKSFADNFLRPWVVATQTFGMLAPQTSNQNYRTNLECYKLSPFPYGSNGSKQSPTIAMKYVFYDVCCVSVGDEEYNYNPITSPVLRDAQFVYSSYAINPTTQKQNGDENQSEQKQNGDGNQSEQKIGLANSRIDSINPAAWT